MEKNIVKIYKVLNGETRYYAVRVMRPDISPNYEQTLDTFAFGPNSRHAEEAFEEALKYAEKVEITPLEPVEQIVYTTKAEPENLEDNKEDLSEL